MTQRFGEGGPDLGCWGSWQHCLPPSPLCNCPVLRPFPSELCLDKEGETQDTGISLETTCMDPGPRTPPGPDRGLWEEPASGAGPSTTAQYKLLSRICSQTAFLTLSTQTKQYLVMTTTLILLRSFQFLGVFWLMCSSAVMGTSVRSLQESTRKAK